MDSGAHACPVCGQPVDTVIRRHKTLGAWVPAWVAGPCRNPDCGANAEQGGAERAEAGEKRPRLTTARGRAESPAGESGTSAAEKT
ncbi:hypothetical protein [Streptomyces sp. ALI-76-A]|jgi:hypothetical protein|uniref:hypothetical protein n=1 Tax=Streptomyces sp. ALI-76-A TaxID=3025736 RepID=UPI00256F2978|nr:hypothetical protein [Streptomyces sp. ALI-76-A]MDL5203754.1 hypothetical protein [Streptomyces sp. ALI-76-A]